VGKEHPDLRDGDLSDKRERFADGEGALCPAAGRFARGETSYMRYVIDPGRERPTLTMRDDICYSHVTDLEGEPLDLTLSLLTIRRPPRRPGQAAEKPAPVILWINGNGWRTPYASRNMMVPELTFLAYQGYAVASVYYRTSGQGKFPAQVVDLKTAVRFLRAHADQYNIDPERIGVYGRSAGGYIAAFLAMNTEDFISEEWSGCSSQVQAACDMFGPVDLTATIRANVELVKDPGFRWHTMEETYDALLLGWEGSVDKLLERGAAASPIRYINDRMCPILIMHGDEDNSVPLAISEAFYEEIREKGLEDRADLYVVAHGGHGSPEFYQDTTRDILLRFFDENLKGEPSA